MRRSIAKRRQARGPRGVEVGFYDTARYPDGTPVTNVAAWNEYGTTRVVRGTEVQHSPPRPFFRNSNARVSDRVRRYIHNNVDPKTLTLTRSQGASVGTILVNDLQNSIRELRVPENRPSTIAIKGTSNPLVESGFMLRSVTYKLT